MTTVSASLEGLARRLPPYSDTRELDAQVLLARALNRPRSWLAAHLEAQVDEDAAAALEKSVQQLERGEPLPYILGEWEFFSLPFEVTPAVLIPRPETELLVEQAIAWLRKREIEIGECNVLDVGTGSGCIAIALAANMPGIQVVATDISPAALDVARRNAGKLNVAGRITFLQADLIPDTDDFPLSGALPPTSYDLIVANLPYIPTQILHSLPIYTREPELALDGGVDGLSLIRRLLSKAPKLLARGGLILLEIEASEGRAALSLAYDAFDQAEIHLHRDLAGKDRLLEIRHITRNETS